MSKKYIQNVADSIYKSCVNLFNERVVDDTLKQNLLKQLKEYFEIEPKDEKYLRSLQFMFENWSNTLPLKESQPKVVHFYKPPADYSKGV